MRGSNVMLRKASFPDIMLDDFTPANHPLRAICEIANAALMSMDAPIATIYADFWKDFISPGHLLQWVLQVLCGHRCEGHGTQAALSPVRQFWSRQTPAGILRSAPATGSSSTKQREGSFKRSSFQSAPGSFSPRNTSAAQRHCCLDNGFRRRVEQGAREGNIVFHYDHFGRLISETRFQGRALRNCRWRAGIPVTQIDRRTMGAVLGVDGGPSLSGERDGSGRLLYRPVAAAIGAVRRHGTDIHCGAHGGWQPHQAHLSGAQYAGQ